MRTLVSIAASALTLIACASFFEPAQKPSAENQTLPLQIEPLHFVTRTLANGLEVYSMPDRNTANVSVQVWYDVGSKDDPVGRSGFAHLFEHIMFKATRNLPAESFDRLTEDVGGFNNASTYDDYTNYYEVVPANHLERVLWAEAERMGTLVIDEANFDSERDVVKEELRQRILAQPYGKLFGLYLAQANFTVHPYGRPGIGSIEDLDASTIDDARAFHATYYRPDNAVLVVSGNFDQAILDQWIDRYFGPIPTPEREIPRVSAKEPERTAPREYTVYEPNTPLPAISISFPGLGSLDPNLAALTVLDAILSKGESSRLYQALVYEQQIAAEVFSWFETTRDPGIYTLAAVLSEGKSPKDGMKSLLVEIARVRDALVSAAELGEAKSELLAEALKRRETAFGRAYELADAVIQYRDPAYADALLTAIQAVTASDVQAVARAILDDQRRVTIRYLSENDKPKRAQADAITTAATIQAQELDIPEAEIPVFALAPEAERAQPPVAGSAVSARLPTLSERSLPNGLRVIVAPRRELPLLSAELRVLSGSGSDPAGHAGIAELAAEIVTKGTKTRSATEIARQIESLGATLRAGAGADSSSVVLDTLSSHAQQAFAIAADVVRNPVFAPAEVELQRQQTLDGLSVDLRQPGSIARFAMARVLFGTGPYGGVISPKSVAAIRAEDVAGFHAAHWRPDNAVLVISGDVSPEGGFELAERFFGDWPKPAAIMAAEPETAAEIATRRSVLIDLPKSGQAAVSFGMRGLARTDDAFFPALVTNSILGGGYSARLNQEIRIKRGLSYGAFSSLPQRRMPGPIVTFAQTRNDAAAQVVDLMESELSKLGESPVPTDELTARSASLIGRFGRDVETTSGIVDQLAQLASVDLPLDKLQSYVADVAAVDADRVKAIAARVYDPKRASLVVVGDGEVCFEAIRKRRPDLERIPVDRLNLDSAALQ